MIPVTPRTTQHLVDWCRTYQESGTVPQPPHIRFSIGFYQISQGMSWQIASPVRWQSFCSASMHFLMCAEAMDIGLGPDLPETLAEIPDTWVSWEHLLWTLGKAQQQIVYALQSSASSSRASRFSASQLRGLLMSSVKQCFSLAPSEYREQGCFDEQKILCHDLPSFKP